MQAGPTTTLPEPDAESVAHSERCAAFIRARIAEQGGSISFGTFMHLALYGPGVGYYTSGNTKFGKDGDFVTAPEVSPLFARVLARQCAEVCADIDSPAILEFGAGSGRLAADLLEKLAELDALPSRYRILEVSPELVARQRATIDARIPQLAERVEWVGEPPSGHRGVVIANEVLDALPVERFTRRDKVRAHRVVVGERGGFDIIEADASDELATAVRTIENDMGQRLPDGFVSEVSLGVDGWTKDMLAAMSEGFAFLFDYGVSRREYYAPDRDGGWLRCHFRHHAHDNPLILTGIQDVTAWVDFTSVATSALRHGAAVAGYTSQAFFLINGGLSEELTPSGAAATADVELSSAAKMLTLPGSMGEHFKCLGLDKGLGIRPTAFQRADRTHTL